MNNIGILIACALTILGLTGCQEADQQTVNSTVDHGILTKFTTEEGLECLHFFSGNQAGISCNWDKYNKEKEG